MKSDYIIITPAYNEQENLPRLADSILQQALSPKMWIIVNDDSTDETQVIIEQLADKYDFIQGVNNKKDSNVHNYALKIQAFNKGYEYLKTLKIDYDYIGNLDADMTLPSDYYEKIIIEFNLNPKLGIAGGSYCYSDNKTKVIWGGNYVPGSILMARRKCFEDAGGYKPLKFGAEDTLLCVEAEVNGWEVKYLPEYQVTQHRIVGTAGGLGILQARFRQGLSDYTIGYHPLFSIIKCIKRLFSESPYIIGSLTRLAGFCFGSLYNCRSFTSKSVIKHLRKKQMRRIAELS